MQKSPLELAKKFVDLLAGIAVVFTLLFVAGQWYEMRKGGEDTKALANAAKAQAEAAKSLAESTKSQADNTARLARAAVEQVQELDAGVRESHALGVAAKRSADASKAIADNAAKELELSERPWVSFSQISIDGPLEFNVNGVNVHFKFQLMNTGHSPAAAVHLSPRMTTAFSEGPSAAQVLGQICADENRITTQMPYFGVTLFPGQPFEQSYSFGMSREEFSKASTRIPGQFTGPSVVICIGYRSTFVDRVYHTGYVFDLYRIDPNTHQKRIDFKLEENIDKQNLLFTCGVANCIVAD